MKQLQRLLGVVCLFFVLFALVAVRGSSAQTAGITFAVIGDFGTANANETAVANLVKNWDPGFIVTTGDNYYSSAGGAGSGKYDRAVGKDYCPFLAGITTSGTFCSQPGPASLNRFFPSLGNHDYTDAGTTNSLPAVYTNYFTLPGRNIAGSGTSGNERYYDFIQGPVHFFVVNSNNGSGQEPNGATSSSVQASWLQNGLAASTSPWNIVVFHHSPYSSGPYGSLSRMQWPFAQWGADVVIAGHNHIYERILRNGIVYFVNGAGGAGLYSCSSTRVQGSQYCYSGYGAQRVTASDTALEFQFIAVGGAVKDVYRLSNASVHVGDLDRTKSLYAGYWDARVTIRVHNTEHLSGSGVAVTGTWNDGSQASCSTGSGGNCVVTKTNIPNTTSQVTFTVGSLSKSGYSYNSAANHDPEGESNGTAITVRK